MAQVNEFPYQAYLKNSNPSVVPFCGAALSKFLAVRAYSESIIPNWSSLPVSDNYALTAAHCLAGRSTTNTMLVVGEHDYSTPNETPFTATYALNTFIVHEGYISSSGVNDIALVRTTYAIQLNLGVGIVCLPFIFGNNLLTNALVTVAGWGTTGFGEPVSKTLLKTDVNVIDQATCFNKYPVASSYNFMCTYYPNRDTCQQDSGTNVFLQSSGRVYSVGVTSGGNGCGTAPALNMRVTQYLAWIRTKTPGASYCEI